MIDTAPLDPMLRLGQLAHWATLGTGLARLLGEADHSADEETREAIATSVALLAPVSRDEIMDAVTALSPLLDVGGRYALVETLTVEQAARALGVVPRTVQKAVAAGDLPAERDGDRIRIRPAALRAYRETPRHPGGRPRKEAP
jgi:excisionase family DNA binding protein